MCPLVRIISRLFSNYEMSKYPLSRIEQFISNFHEIDRPIYRFGDGTNETGAKQTSTSRLIAVPKKGKLTENSLTELIFIRYRPPRATLESRVR